MAELNKIIIVHKIVSMEALTALVFAAILSLLTVNMLQLSSVNRNVKNQPDPEPIPPEPQPIPPDAITIVTSAGGDNCNVLCGADLSCCLASLTREGDSQFGCVAETDVGDRCFCSTNDYLCSQPFAGL